MNDEAKALLEQHSHYVVRTLIHYKLFKLYLEDTTLSDKLREFCRETVSVTLRQLQRTGTIHRAGRTYVLKVSPRELA